MPRHQFGVIFDRLDYSENEMIHWVRSQGQWRLGSVKRKTAWSRPTQPTVTSCQSQATACFLSRVRSKISYHSKMCFARPAFCKWGGKFPSVRKIPQHSKREAHKQAVRDSATACTRYLKAQFSHKLAWTMLCTLASVVQRCFCGNSSH
jgi:hypothetical protein